MSVISTRDFPPMDHFFLWAAMQSHEKRSAVSLSGLLQVTLRGYLLVGVPTALVRGVYDAISEPGISFPSTIDGGALRAGIVVMTPEEVQDIGGPSQITERGKQFTYHLGELTEVPARNWPGVSTCWHLQIKSPELTKLRRSYGLPSLLSGESEFSIVVACRKVGVLSANATSKSVDQKSSKLPDWTLP